MIGYVGIPTRTAVICAYAQREKRDWNTWQYEERYGKLVQEGELTYIIGDWSVFKDGRRIF